MFRLICGKQVVQRDPPTFRDADMGALYADRDTEYACVRSFTVFGCVHGVCIGEVHVSVD